jgi:hypothetical protein
VIPDDAREDRIAEWLLVETVAELDRLVSAEDATPFQTLDIATMVRRALFEKAPLANQARRRLAIAAPAFHCRPLGAERRTMVYQGDTPRLDVPDKPFGAPIQKLNMDRFKRARVCVVDESTYSVGDVVKYFAHVRGAVHLGKPKTGLEELMLLVDSTITTGIWPMPWMILVDIGEVTANALRPMAEQLRPEVPDGWTRPWRPAHYGYRRSY